LITATVMTLGVCQGRSSIASFSILTSALRGPSAIAEPLVIQYWSVTDVRIDTRQRHIQSLA